MNEFLIERLSAYLDGNARDDDTAGCLISDALDALQAGNELLAALQGLVAVLDKQLLSAHAAERASPLGKARAAIANVTGQPA
jgi:hypothetical protein